MALSFIPESEVLMRVKVYFLTAGNQKGSVSRARYKLLYWKAHCEPRFGGRSKRCIRAEIMKQSISKD